MILEDFTRLPPPARNKTNQEVDPALLTFEEWAKVVDAYKSHPSSAYESNVAEMNEYSDGVSGYPKLIQRIRRNGLNFELRMKSESRQYCKRDTTGEYLRDDQNALVYYTNEEIEKLGWPSHEYSFAIFDDKGQRVAKAQDEWGCVLVATAREYRQFGFGDILGRVVYSVYPGKTTGGTTSAGFSALRRLHREFVADALRQGRYRGLIERGVVSYPKVKSILASAGLPRAPKSHTEHNLASNDPKDWLLFADDYGTFILYDKKLKDLYRQGEKFEHWQEEFIKGMVYVFPGERYGIVWVFGGETKGIRSFLLRCAQAFCENNNCTLVLDPEDVGSIDPKFLKAGTRNNSSGVWRQPVKRVGDKVDVRPWIDLEALHRRTHDEYDEFKNFMHELAEAKYKQ